MDTTILVSDDEPSFIEVMTRFARARGIAVVPDVTSRVVELARERRPALIFLDIRQTIDGRDLLQRLKSDPQTRDIPVIAWSGCMDEFTRALCIELGALDALEKPIGRLEFVTVLDHRATHPPLSALH